MNTGQRWTATNQHITPEQEYLTQRERFAEIQTGLEQSAADFFMHLQTTEIPRSVRQASDLGRTTVGFYASSWHLNTAAFVSFRQWLQGEGLSCMCAQLAPDQREGAEQDIVLNIFPYQG